MHDDRREECYCRWVQNFMSVFMSDFFPESDHDSSSRSTKAEMDIKVAFCADLLLQGLSSASVVRASARKYRVTARQARRYVKLAMLESFDAPLATDELGFSIANHMERLELIADAAAKEGDRKTEISATKAAIQATERRLKAIEDIDHRTNLMRKKYGE